MLHTNKVFRLAILSFLSYAAYGQITFSSQTYPLNHPVDKMADGDLTGDGKPDIIAIDLNATSQALDLPGTVSVLLNNGDGTFSAPKTYTNGAAQPFGSGPF